MSYTILSPHDIWNGFRINSAINVQPIEEKTSDGVLYSKYFLSGEKTPTGEVKIFVEIARSVQLGICPGMFCLKEFGKSYDYALIKRFVEEGYIVMVVDMGGENAGGSFCTVYPVEKNFAYFEKAREHLYEGIKDVYNNCWIEWGKTARYALKYFASLPYVSKIGGIASSRAAAIMWQISATDSRLSAFTVINNSGWRSYRGISKFDDSEPDFNDSELSFIAGIEPQSYAKQTKCPCLLLCSSNSNKNDMDRSVDTFVRLSDRTYKAFDCSVGRVKTVDYKAFNDVVLFFSKFLKGTDLELPKKIQITAQVKDSNVEVEVYAHTHDPETIKLYYAEEEIKPSLRCYKSTKEFVKKGDKYIFTVKPYCGAGVVTVFARAEYKNGFTICSNSVQVKFSESEMEHGHKTGIIYSSRVENDANIFMPACEETGSAKLDYNDDSGVMIKGGPMDLNGVYCKHGLISFKVNVPSEKPKDDAILMLDVFVKSDATVTVSLITDFFGDKNYYSRREELKGVNAWHNLKEQINKFKSETLGNLRSYEKVEALEITADSEFIINNILWV